MKRLLMALCVAAIPAMSFAQMGVQLDGLSVDPTQPIETKADSLSIDRNTGSTVFEGNVLVGQGDLRMTANRIEIVTADQGGISKMVARGKVLFTTRTDALEAESAEYDLAKGVLSMRGNVLLTQGENAIMADVATISVRTGTARFDGNVRTLLQAGNSQ